MTQPLRGVSLAAAADGFSLRASCLSFVDTVMRVGVAAAVSALPFVLWWDLIRGVWTDEGFSFWLTCLFLAVWAAAIGYADWIALVSLFGEVRVVRRGDAGEIFTGLGKAGWTHRLRWSEFEAVSATEVRSSTGRKSTTRYVVLTGPGKRYRFGWQLPAERQDFVVGALRKHVFSDPR